jgi:hypothetical protein
MDKLAGFRLDGIPEQRSDSAPPANQQDSNPAATSLDLHTPQASTLARYNSIEESDYPKSSQKSDRRQSHSDSTRPSVKPFGLANRVASGGREAMNGPSTGNGNQTIPIPREAFHRFSSSGARRAEDGFDKVNKRKPVGFKDKLKREEAGIVKRRSGAVLARG